MISKIKKPVSILLSLIMVFSLFAIVPITASAASSYFDLARGTLIQPGDILSFEEIGSFKFADYNDPTIIHEVKGSDFSNNRATLSVTDGYYSFGSTKLLPTSVSPGGLLIADYDSTTKMATFGVQNITHSFDETTGTLTIGGSGVVPCHYAMTGSNFDGVVFTQSNLVKHLIIDATDMIAIKQDAFMAYNGGCVLEDVKINSTSSTPLIIEKQAVFYRSGNNVTVTVNAVELATVTNSPVNNYGTPVNLIYNVEQPITFKKNALTDSSRYLTVTFPTHCNIFIPGGAQFTDSRLQEEYDRLAEDGYEEFFWKMHSGLVEGTDYVLGDARYEELTPLNASLVVGNKNTALFSAYTITDESVNGTVTASVNGTDVTEAAADADVLLTVAPAKGYQFVSISAGDVSLTTVTEGSQYSLTMPRKFITVKAEFEAIPTYTVTWKNGDTVLKTDTVEEGSTPTYDGETPTKAADGDHMYVFSGWTPELAPVTEDVTYTATFASSANLVEITDHETDLGDLGIDEVMSEWGRSMTAQEAITLARYMSAQNDGAKCAVLYEVVDGYDLQYAMSDGTTGSRTSFYNYPLNEDDFLPDYKVYYLPVNLNPQTIELNLNQDNATVIWYDATDSDGYWSMEAAYNDSCYLVLKGNSDQPAGTYEWADMGSCEISDIDASQRIDFVDGSCTVTVDEDVVTVSGTFTGRDRNTYVVTVTYEAPYYTITDESVNGTVTAEVNGADVTKAKAGKTVLLNVAPADGYQLKSITASAQKTTPENFSDLVALMGDAVFDGDEDYNCAGYTCKVENGKFVVYNGTTLVTELSESNMTEFTPDTDYVEANSDNVEWTFFVENGEITEIDVADANADYDTIFSSVSGSKSTGTLQPVQLALTTVTEGSQYSFTMPNKPVTVTAEFEAIPTPAPAKLTLNVGENGKVVMNNGTFGNATDASNISEIRGSVNVADGYNGSIANVSIVDGHTCNIVEGGSINIATGGEVSFYPSADNTGKITAIPDEGYICTGWYNGDTRYTTKDTIDYQEISEDMTLTAKFAPDLFPQHSITLGGNIGVNFFINSKTADFASDENAYVKFTWDNGTYNKEVKLKDLTTDAKGYYKATVDVVAAQMAHKIHAEVYLNGEKLEQTDDYSVQDYAETVFANPEKYDNKNKPKQLAALAQALLNYGAMAQIVFDEYLVEKPELANKTVGDNGYAAVTAEQIGDAVKGTSADLNKVAEKLGAEYYTSSLIYLSKNTLRVYFTPTTYPGTIPNADKYAGNLSDYYYYVDHANIPAAELDEQKELTVGDYTFTYTALDYAKAVVNSGMGDDQKNLAKALYLYNQKANAYFDDAPAPVENVVDLGTLQGDYEAQDGDVLINALSGDYQITIAAGATVTETRRSPA